VYFEFFWRGLIVIVPAAARVLDYSFFVIQRSKERDKKHRDQTTEHERILSAHVVPKK
jgi:hypothetical protein